MERNLSAEPIVYDFAVIDLPPKNDPKGGSPRTPPRGIPVREYQTEREPPAIVHVNGAANTWRTIAGTLLGLLLGVGMAYVTAFRERGVTRIEMEQYMAERHTEVEKHVMDAIPKYIARQEMEEYVKAYSPWVFDKQFVIGRLSNQDQQLGAMQQKMDVVAKLLEELQKFKK